MKRVIADQRLADALSAATGLPWGPDRDSINVTAAAVSGRHRVTRSWRAGRVTLWDNAAHTFHHLGTFDGRGWEGRVAEAVREKLGLGVPQ